MNKILLCHSNDRLQKGCRRRVERNNFTCKQSRNDENNIKYQNANHV